MSFRILVTPNFVAEAKRLSKKYTSLKSDLDSLFRLLSLEPSSGVPLGGGVYKIRLAIRSKGRGKSGGARVITFVRIVERSIYLISIFDKSERESIPDEAIRRLIKSLPLPK
jgi:mRNA-degrading endonuclease RelE of RelBE toxin-antitoxin system